MLFRIKRRVVIHRDKELLSNAVINNLVPEDKRKVLFSTQLSDDESLQDEKKDDAMSKILTLEERINKLEIIVKKLVEYLIKESQQIEP